MQDTVLVKSRTLAADMYYKDTAVLKYRINYPWLVTSHFPVLSINQYYAEQAAAYERYVRTVLFDSALQQYDYSVQNGYPVREYEAVLNFTVPYNENCVLSLYFDKYEYTGGAHGNTVRSSDTWDLESARRISLSRLFPSYASKAPEMINSEIARRMETGSDWYFDDYQKNVAEYFNPQSFYLTPQGITIYFQQYEIAPYASGIPEFTIPYSSDVIRPEYCRPQRP